MSRLGGKIVEMKKVNKGLWKQIIVKRIWLHFSGERVGIIGKNGVGKSTFINLIQQLEQLDSGKINIDDTVIFGNFSQEGLEIKEDVRVIEYVKTFAESFPLVGGGSISASQFLNLFISSRKAVYLFKFVKWWRKKTDYKLLAILFRNPNFLILDKNLPMI